ncbi:synaptic vesicle glycoprotein 2B [Harpegnathos saltator]|uniref:synaptic vesicle glycoprotein 2B n=1 Tax=Harpegnathos saltator TaxID=610380 RepID=UPI000DBED3FC|nr:synaptic vesicle glycoprotein 2B [Harpegnathos saltator]XP_025164007.1 synaptic vesicle glycoprotein 2B [Harpegnathos saltator]
MTAEKKKPEQTNSIVIEDAPSAKIADFETAITAAGTGKFQYFLVLAIIPASWASSVDTANMSMILASAEGDLGLSLFNKGLLNAIVYMGMVLSGFIWGYLADVKGRKKVILYGYLADGVCNVLAGFSQNFGTLVFFKFLSGMLVSGPHATLMAYCTEFYGDKGRAKIPILVGFSVQFGCVVNAVMAWLVVPQPWSIVLWDGAFVYNSWRIFLSLCGVPTMIGVLCLCFFPESPKFLMTQNRNEEALEVFKRIYSTNTGLPKDSYPIGALGDVNLNNVTAERSLESQGDAKSSFKDGIRQMTPILSKPYPARILLLVTVQFGGMLCLNTLRLWQPQLFATIENFKNLDTNVTDPTFCEILDISTSLDAARTVAVAAAPAAAAAATDATTAPSISENSVSESMYTDTIIVSSSSSVFILLASVLVNFLEHKYLLLVSYGCALVCLISLIWATNTLVILVLTCMFVGLLSETFNVVVGATVLLFPTSLRAMAVSMEMIVGRIGSMIGNLLFPVLLAHGCVAPIINLACFTLLCIILTCFLPSTSKHAV